MSNAHTTRPFTIRDAADRALYTFASIVLTLAALVLAYRYSTDIVAGWHVVSSTVRAVWGFIATGRGILAVCVTLALAVIPATLVPVAVEYHRAGKVDHGI